MHEVHNCHHQMFTGVIKIIGQHSEIVDLPSIEVEGYLQGSYKLETPDFQNFSRTFATHFPGLFLDCVQDTEYVNLRHSC